MLPSFVCMCVCFLSDSSIVSDVVLQDLLAHVSSKHSYLRDLRLRPPQEVSSVEFVALEQLQPGVLVHVLLRVVDVTVLTGDQIQGLLSVQFG